MESPRCPSRASSWPVLGLAAAISACGGGEDDPVGPTLPPPDPIGAEQALVAEPLGDGAPYWAAALPGDQVVAGYAGGARLFAPGGASALPTLTGELSAAAAWSPGALVAGTDGIFVLRDGAVARSPLSEAMLGIRPMGLLEAPGPQLWAATDAGLAVWVAGELFWLDTGELPSTDCVMDAGGTVGGQPAVWVACQGTLYGLVGNAPALRAHAQPTVSDVQDLAVDGAGTLWIVTGSGAVFSRSPAEQWRSHDFATDVRAVAAGADTEVWFGAMSGLWRKVEDRFHPIAASTGSTLLTAAGPGSVLVQTSAGLARWHTEPRVWFLGLEDESLLAAVTEVEIAPMRPDDVTDLRATLDDAAVDVDATNRVTLDPADFTDGSHVLAVVVTYADGTEVSAERRFTVLSGPPPTWTADIQPLFRDSCALCHDAGASARRLDTSSAWQDEIDLILENVRAGRMPLPPNPMLTAEQVGRVEAWKAAGFPEGE